MQTRTSPSVETLHRLAQQVRLEHYDSMPKALLYETLKKQYDLDRLLRAEKRSTNQKKRTLSEMQLDEHENSSQQANCSMGGDLSSSPSKRKSPVNQTDPIMLCKIDKRKSFSYTRSNGSVVRFNLESLIDYLICSGEFSDPQTRIPFTDEDLAKMDKLAEKYGFQKPSVVDAKKNVLKYSNAKCQRDALLAVERCAGELIRDILEIAENCDEPDDAQMELMTDLFPAFSDLYRQMKTVDKEYAAKCLAQWMQFIRGPPNRPNQDEYGLIQVISIFLRSLA